MNIGAFHESVTAIFISSTLFLWPVENFYEVILFGRFTIVKYCELLVGYNSL